MVITWARGKSTSEIDDINNALMKLAEKEVFSIFVGTSNMVMQTPMPITRKLTLGFD